MAFNNKLEILEEYKEGEVLNYEELNNNICNSTIIGVNLIDSIKNYYSGSLKIDVSTLDDSLKQFFEVSISNYFTTLYYNQTRKKIHEFHFETSNGIIYFNDGRGYNTPFIPYGENNGITISRKDNSNIYVEHTKNITPMDYNASADIPDKNNGYDQSVTFNGYNINKQGHVIKNTGYTINFPSEYYLSYSQSFGQNESSYRVTGLSVDSYRQFSLIHDTQGEHYNFFLLTFYYTINSITYYFTLPFNSGELFFAHEFDAQDKVVRFINGAGQQQYCIWVRFKNSYGSFSTGALEVRAEKIRTSSPDLYIKRISMFIISNYS